MDFLAISAATEVYHSQIGTQNYHYRYAIQIENLVFVY